MLGAESGWKCFFAGAEELLEEIQQSQVQLVRRQAELKDAMLAREHLKAALEEAGQGRKRSRPSHNTHQASEMQLKQELQVSLRSVQPAGQGRPLTGRVCAGLMAARSSPDMPGIMNAACGLKIAQQQQLLALWSQCWMKSASKLHGSCSKPR